MAKGEDHLELIKQRSTSSRNVTFRQRSNSEIINYSNETFHLKNDYPKPFDETADAPIKNI